MVVTIRCECENLHTFSVVFGQHKSITFVRTDIDLVARKERSSLELHPFRVLRPTRIRNSSEVFRVGNRSAGPGLPSSLSLP